MSKIFGTIACGVVLISAWIISSRRQSKNLDVIIEEPLCSADGVDARAWHSCENDVVFWLYS